MLLAFAEIKLPFNLSEIAFTNKTIKGITQMIYYTNVLSSFNTKSTKCDIRESCFLE